jgi:aminomethyltransferase
MHWLFKSNFEWCLSIDCGKAQYSCLPNNDGGIVDDLIIYKMKEEIFISCKCIEYWQRLGLISAQNDLGVEMKTFGWLLFISNQGPKAVEAMQALSSIDLSAFHITTLK